jgi:hypothetical protein
VLLELLGPEILVWDAELCMGSSVAANTFSILTCGRSSGRSNIITMCLESGLPIPLLALEDFTKSSGTVYNVLCVRYGCWIVLGGYMCVIAGWLSGTFACAGGVENVGFGRGIFMRWR